MNINICYNNKNNKFEVDPLESILSIKSRFFSNNENNLDDYEVFLDNKKLEDQDYLDKFTITNGQKLNIYTKIKGGREGAFLYYFFGTIIVLLPIIILALGFIPAFSSMLGIILQKSFGKIFDYLECNLGKKTLVSRFKWLSMSVVQYLVLGLMIYVIITIPLTILCTMLRGERIFDNPLNLCKPLKTANTAGSLLIIFYFMFYFILRYGNWLGSTILDFCKQNYYLNTIFSPMVQSLLNFYNRTKYLPVAFIPLVGLPITNFMRGIELILPVFYTLLVSIKDAGCKKILNKTKFLNVLKSKISNKLSEKKMDDLSTTSDKSIKSLSSKASHVSDTSIKSLSSKKLHGGAKNLETSSVDDENIFITLKNQENLNKNREELKSSSVLLEKCIPDGKNPCCSKDNMVTIGDSLKDILDFPIANTFIKGNNLYFVFILFIQSFYEQAINKSSSNEELKVGEIPDKKIYLKKILNERSDALSPKVKDIINKYLYETNNHDTGVDIKKIFDMINVDISKENFGNEKLIKDIKYKLANLDQEALDYAKLTKTKYNIGGTFIKMILKNILIDGACNVFNTANSSINLIESMGQISNVTDMINSGITAGSFISIIYVITVIILIIMRIFGLF
jgi:hypothetical protein